MLCASRPLNLKICMDLFALTKHIAYGLYRQSKPERSLNNMTGFDYKTPQKKYHNHLIFMR